MKIIDTIRGADEAGIACQHCQIPDHGNFHNPTDHRQYVCAAMTTSLPNRYIIDRPCTVQDWHSCRHNPDVLKELPA